MTNPYYDHTTYPAEGSKAKSSGMKAELDRIEAGFDAVETALSAKADISGEAYTGAHNFTAGSVTVPTRSQNDNSVNAASTAYVDATIATATAVGAAGQLPGQTGNSGKFLTTDGTVSRWAYVDSPWQIKTTAYTAVAGDRILADTSGGAFTITLPALAVGEPPITIKDASKTFASNNITVARAGELIESEAADYALNLNGETRSFEPLGGTIGWGVI